MKYRFEEKEKRQRDNPTDDFKTRTVCQFMKPHCRTTKHHNKKTDHYKQHH